MARFCPDREGFMASTRENMRVAQTAFFVQSKTIPATVIFKRFVDVLGGSHDIDLDRPITDFLKGKAIPWDLALKFMKSDEFSPDGLKLNKRDVLKLKTIGDLGDLIFKWYATNGWTITGLGNA
jgi:hypothetical protein